jgi:hypothetical protein
MIKEVTSMKKILIALLVIGITSIYAAQTNAAEGNKIKLKYEATVTDYSTGLVNVKMQISNISTPTLLLRPFVHDGFHVNPINLAALDADGKPINIAVNQKLSDFGSGTTGEEWVVTSGSNKEVTVTYTCKKNEPYNNSYKGYIGDGAAVISGEQIFISPSDVSNIDSNIEVRFNVPTGSSILCTWYTENGVYYPNTKFLEYEIGNPQVDPVVNLLRSTIVLGKFNVYDKVIETAHVKVAVPSSIDAAKSQNLSNSLFTMYGYYTNLFGGSMSKDYFYVYLPQAPNNNGITISGWSLGQGMDSSDGYYSLTHTAHGFFHRWNGWLYGWDIRDMGVFCLEAINRYYEGKSVVANIDKLSYVNEFDAHYLQDMYNTYKKKFGTDKDMVYATTQFDSTPSMEDCSWIMYEKGALIWMALDFKIKEDTNYTKSLDDVVKIFESRFGFYKEIGNKDKIIAILKQVSGKDYTEFINDYVYGKKFIDLERYFKDSDGDYVPDYVELMRNTDPTTKNTFPAIITSKFRTNYGTMDANGNITSIEIANGYRPLSADAVWLNVGKTACSQDAMLDFIRNNTPGIHLTTQEGKQVNVKSSFNGYSGDNSGFYAPGLQLNMSNNIIPGVNYKVTTATGSKLVLPIDEDIIFTRPLDGKDITFTTLKIEGLPTSGFKTGDTSTIKITGLYDGGTEDLTSSALITAENTKLVSIDDYGTMSALGSGNTIVTAKINGLTTNAAIQIDDKVTLSNISITQNNAVAELIVGRTNKLSTLYTYSNNTTTVDNSDVIWESSDNTIATIDNTGLVTALKEGKVTLTASSGNIKDSLNMNIKANVHLTGITILPNTINIKKGKSVSLKVYATYSDKSKVDITAKSQWDIGNSKLISSLKAGTIQIGKYTLTVTYNNYKAQVNVNIKK